MTRTDTHRPKLLDPAEYEFVGAFYQGSSMAMAEAYADEGREYEENMEALGNPPFFEGNHAEKGTCDHCGARFAHGVGFYHRPSKRIINVGHTCAANTVGLPSRAEVVRKKAEKAQAKAAEIARWREEALDASEPEEREDFEEWLNRPMPEGARGFVADVRAKWQAGGSISLRQAEVAVRIMREAGAWFEHNAALVAALEEGEGLTGALAEFRATIVRGDTLSEGQTRFAHKLLEELESDGPVGRVPEGRARIEGVVRKTAWKSYGGGFERKVWTVELPNRARVWGTVPESLWEAEAGDRVAFTATFEPKEGDDTFGFYKRPTKPELVEQAEKV